jgi:hypothetical protein
MSMMQSPVFLTERLAQINAMLQNNFTAISRLEQVSA